MTATDDRQAAVAGLDGRHFDAVVIGGGIDGAAVTRDATLRGLSVCLFEQGDFASGTSSKSTKIAHGGLRYLKQLELGLVFKSQQERLILRRLLPHLVWPQSFCYPVYERDPDPLWKVRLGLTVYDVLATFRNVHQHRSLSVAEALAANPSLRSDGLRGAVRYWDDRMDDARICLESVLSAEKAGATCLSYAKVLDVSRKGLGYGVRFQDVRSAVEGTVTCNGVVNCAGPWADAVARLAVSDAGPYLMPTKGVHIVVPRIPIEDALILPDAGDGRPFFVIPWDDRSLIGTTDTRYGGPPSKVCAEPEDLDYLLAAARRYLGASAPAAEDVSFAFAGLRPLVAPNQRDLPEGRISRRHLVVVTPPAFVTLVGGKYTTFRRMAEDATDRLMRAIGRARGPHLTRRQPFFADMPPSRRVDANEALWSHLQASYGPRAGAVYDVCMSDERYRRQVLESSPVVLGQLAYALVAEKALTLDDLLFRRTHLVWQPDMTSAAAHGVIDSLAPLFADTEEARGQADSLDERKRPR